MSTVGLDAVRGFIRTNLEGDTSDATALFNSSNENRVHGVFEDVARDEHPWPRLIIRVSGASNDGASPVVFFNVTIVAETDWNGDGADRGMDKAHAIINRVREVLQGLTGSGFDSEANLWRFSPVERVQGSQSAAQRLTTQSNAVSETYLVVGTTGSSSLRVQSESSATIAAGLGLDVEGFTVQRTVEVVDVTPIGLLGVAGANDFERKVAPAMRGYRATYRGKNTGVTPALPTTEQTVRLSLSSTDYFESTAAVYTGLDFGASRSANGTIPVQGTIHLNPGVEVADG